MGSLLQNRPLRQRAGGSPCRLHSGSTAECVAEQRGEEGKAIGLDYGVRRERAPGSTCDVTHLPCLYGCLQGGFKEEEEMMRCASA